MSTYFGFYVVILFITSVVSFSTGIFSFKRRKTSGALPLSLMMFSICVWSFFQAVVFLADSYETKAFFSNLRFLGVVYVNLFWMYCAVNYYYNEITLKKVGFVSLFAVMTTEFYFIWSYKANHLFFLGAYIINTQFGKIIHFIIGPMFYFYYALHFLMVCTGFSFFIRSYFTVPKLYRRRASLLLITVIIPVPVNLIFVLNVNGLQYLDYTPVAVLITGLAMAYGLFYMGFLDVIPIAKDVILQDTDDIIFIVDNQNRLLELNPPAKKHLSEFMEQRAIENSYGKDFSQLTYIWPELFERLNNQSEDTSILVLPASENKPEYFNLKVSLIQNRYKVVIGKIIELKNITVLQNALIKEETSRKKAEMANLYKSRFLANMSHEIRTPMNAVVGMTDLLFNEETDSVKKQKLKTIMNSAESLLVILNDILDYSKIEAGKMNIELTAVSFNEIASECIQMLKISADDKKISLNLEIQEDIPRYLLGDPVRIKQIITNLLGNAIKFTNKGEVSLKIGSKPLNDKKHLVYIKVIDSGIGMETSQIDKLFEGFTQQDVSTTRKYGGTGLGLTIVKNLVELMDGNIIISSLVGIGTTINVRIPFLEAAAPAFEHVEVKQDFLRIKDNLPDKLNVLVTDDNITNQSFIKTILLNRNIHCDFANNGEEAYELVKNGACYDVILMDIQMPVMDGFEATTKIRELGNQCSKNVKIIALTANAMRGDKEECLKYGMDDYLAKPVKANQLYEKIMETTNKNVLSESSREKARRGKAYVDTSTEV